NLSVAIPDILPIFNIPPGSLGHVNRTEAEVKEVQGPQYSNSYLPALMQVLQHYTELMQYEPLQPPKRTTTTQRTTTRYTTTTPRTTKYPSWMVQSTTQAALQESTPPHRPGYFSPERPPRPVLGNKRPLSQPQKPEQTSFYRPSQTPIRPSTGNFFSTPDANKQFYNWFFQDKSKKLETNFDYDLQLLDPLPKALLHDIEQESPHLPALLDEDNVEEFLKMYDDHFARNVATTGRKKVPPTKPYVEMVVLYDILKREAKALMLNKFTGYSEEVLRELQMTSQWTGDKQLHFILSKTLERKDVTRADIVARLTSMIKDLGNPNNITTKTVSQIPPLQFSP
uniref:Uncharacterized protein n=3 Tax=Lutzomyia longipalpis TaxID=7200 RepID=A0A1B0EWH9_LUTLO